MSKTHLDHETHPKFSLHATPTGPRIHGGHGKDRVRADWSHFEKPAETAVQQAKPAKSWYTKDEVTAMTAEWKPIDADNEFLKKDGPGPFMSQDTQRFVETTMGALEILAFLAGPEGIVVAAGISFASGMIGLANGATDKIKDVAAEAHKLQMDEKLITLLNNLNSFLGTVNNNHERFVGLQEYEKQTAEGSTEPEGSLYVNETTWIKPLIEWLRNHTLGGGPDRLATCTNDLGSLKEHPPWDRPDVRYAILHADSLLWLAYKLLAILHARLAAGSRYHEKGKVTQDYLDNICACHNALSEMTSTMATRKEDAKERIKKAKEGRKNQITAIQTERENWGHPIGYVNRYTFTDQWTGRKPTDKMETAEPGSAERQATKDREEYLKRLDAHIERVFRADEVILASWEKISQEVQGLLIPPTPRDPPTHEVEYKEVLKPSSALRGYTKVAYRYSVTTVHGTSGQSPWTEDLPIDTNEKKKVPVLVFGSTAFIIGAEPTVNIERRVSNPKEGSGVPAGPIVAAAGVLKRVVSEIHWSDEEHLPHGRG